MVAVAIGQKKVTQVSDPSLDDANKNGLKTRAPLNFNEDGIWRWVSAEMMEKFKGAPLSGSRKSMGKVVDTRSFEQRTLAAMKSIRLVGLVVHGRSGRETPNRWLVSPVL